MRGAQISGFFQRLNGTRYPPYRLMMVKIKTTKLA
jgi:hypothetical protein